MRTNARSAGLLSSLLIAAALLLTITSLACGGGQTVTSGETATAVTAQGRTITLVSIDANGNQADGRSWAPCMAAGGDWVGFESDATNLVPGDTNNVRDIFVKNPGTGEIQRASTSSTDGQSNGPSFATRITPDGRFVVFSSDATNLIDPGQDTNGAMDIFLKDRNTGETARVSVDADGNQADGPSELPEISDDGRLVIFSSKATNLVPDDTNKVEDVFVKDMSTGAVTRVSTDSSGAESNGQSGFRYGSAISGNGLFAAFESDASNLVKPDTNNQSDIFVKDMTTGATTLVSSTSSGDQALNGPSLFPRLSTNGQFVSFRSEADNLVAGDTNGTSDVFVKDTTSGDLAVASADADGNVSDNGAWDPSISGDGFHVVFSSNSTGLVATSTDGIYNNYLKDLQTGAIQILTLNPAGDTGNDWSDAPTTTVTARRTAFESKADNLVAGDTNGVPDIFMVDLGV